MGSITQPPRPSSAQVDPFEMLAALVVLASDPKKAQARVAELSAATLDHKGAEAGAKKRLAEAEAAIARSQQVIDQATEANRIRSEEQVKLEARIRAHNAEAERLKADRAMHDIAVAAHREGVAQTAKQHEATAADLAAKHAAADERLKAAAESRTAAEADRKAAAEDRKQAAEIRRRLTAIEDAGA